MKKDDGKVILAAVLLALGINYGCQQAPGKKITGKELSAIANACSQSSYPVNLYYLDGDCSSCLLKAKAFDEQKYGKGAGSILVFKALNPVMARMYINDISIRSCVILDSTGVFAGSFALNTVYEVSEKGEVISEKPDK